jgi:hypothetical protein
MRLGLKMVRNEETFARQALRASISHLFERRSVLREHEILAEALNQSLGSLDLERLKQAASSGEGGLVRLTDSPGNRLLSECCTRRGLRLEQQAVQYANDTRNTCPALNSRFVPAAHLSEGQKKAVSSILSTRDRVFSFRGVAGSGKTTGAAGSSTRTTRSGAHRLCRHANSIGGTNVAK